MAGRGQSCGLHCQVRFRIVDTQLLVRTLQRSKKTLTKGEKLGSERTE